MSLYHQDGYASTNGVTSAIRLNFQHHLWKEILGNNIKFSLQDGQDVRIADVGTGTGIWILDVSRQLSSARLDGFDISSEQFPRNDSLPANVSLQTLDVFAPIPEELIGRYDLVNVQLFLAIVRNDDPRPILKNLISMLKPGGHLQWTDLYLNSFKILPANPAIQPTALKTVHTMLKSKLRTNWVPLLPHILYELGLEDVISVLYPTPHHLDRFFTELQLMTYEEYSYLVFDEEQGPKYRALIRQAAEEVREGACLSMSPQATMGRKGS